MRIRTSQKFGSGFGVVVVALVGLACHDAVRPGGANRSMAGELAVAPNAAAAASVSLPTTSVAPARIPTLTSLEVLAQNDPEAFIRQCRDEYDRRNIRDYTCRFIKQESIRNRLGEVEEAAVRFREIPFSVDMEWTRNASQANRALYVADAWRDRKGRELAWFKPAGALIKLIVPRIKQPVTGARAKKASRRTLDQFGFRSTLELIVKYIEKGRANDDVEVRYVGEDTVEGRTTWVFERHLPFTGEEQPYPDALLIYHIDREWLVPVACFSYADHEGRELLGSYVLTDIKFNVGLGDDDFDPEKLGF